MRWENHRTEEAAQIRAKRQTARTTRRKTTSRKGTGGVPRALAGKAVRGKEIDPSSQRPEAMAAGVAELRQPRPYTSRYPIPEEEFQRLKEKATHLRLPL